jgi:hypothetical protein
MKYSKKDNYYEFGPLLTPNRHEKSLVEKATQSFQSSGYFFVNPNLARKKVGGLFSDCRNNGDASIFDELFSDTHSYHDEIVRFVDKDLVDPTGVKIRWSKYYFPDMTLRRSEEYRYFPSGNVEWIEFDAEGMISKIKIWRDIGKKSHQEFLLDIVAEYKKRRSKSCPKIRN